jgi:hypothetical protein
MAVLKAEPMKERHDCAGLRVVLILESRHEIDGKLEQETRCYLTSLVWPGELTGARGPKSSKRGKQPPLNMIFREDEWRIRSDYAPVNFTTLKHMALNLIRKAPRKDSLHLRRKVAPGTTNPEGPRPSGERARQYFQIRSGTCPTCRPARPLLGGYADTGTTSLGGGNPADNVV